ncbi:MAG: hypothetical protein ACI9GW_000008 [Halieaceae bacterium]|jgi:hypothetical protein
MQVDELIAAAQQQTGLSQLGDDGILEALGRLVDALNSEAKLTDRGTQSVQANLIATLANRMKVEDYLARHPHVLERPIEKPLFVFGLPRTGTTLAINLLSADPSRRSFLRWEAFDSVPPPQTSELHGGPRYEASQAQIEMSLKYAPHISAIHHEDADSPTECQFSMSPSFVAQYYDSMYDIPSYHQWFLHEADYLPAFQYHKRLLQLLQAQTGGRWTLKNPWHPLYLKELTTIYPDAQLVMTHRDPVDVVGSACSLVNTVRPMFSDDVDPKVIGQSLLETFDVMIARTLAYKEKHGWDSICDIQYADVMRDPIEEIRKVYQHFDEPFTAEAETAMNRYIQDNPKGKHGSHAYSLEDYGLNKEQIRERYKDYCERFAIPVKS